MDVLDRRRFLKLGGAAVLATGTLVTSGASAHADDERGFEDPSQRLAMILRDLGNASADLEEFEQFAIGNPNEIGDPSIRELLESIKGECEDIDATANRILALAPR